MTNDKNNCRAMFTIAALFRPQGLNYGDHDDHFWIAKPCSARPGYKDWLLRIPKDGLTDMWRLQEAVEEKTRGGRGVVMIPYLKSDDLPSEAYWSFKEQWDNRSISETTHMWGGAFVSKAEDYDDGEEYQVLDLTQAPHYYNILLNIREKREFQQVNPGLAYVECTDACLAKRHFHGVHGLYKGAVLEADFGVGGAKIAPRFTAPPLSLLEAWRELPGFNMKQNEGVPFIKEHEGPGDEGAAARCAIESDVGTTSKRAGRIPKKATVGARAMMALMQKLPHWPEVEVAYRTPESAKWADPEKHVASAAGQRKLREKWNAEYTKVMLPMVQGEGNSVDAVLRKAWNSDSDPMKVKAAYFLRRLTAGNSGVYEDERGYVVIAPQVV